jgi:hypothetical protein
MRQLPRLFNRMCVQIGWCVMADLYEQACADRDYWREKAERLEDFVREISEEDCHYGDGCPVFGSNHGRCLGCKARRAREIPSITKAVWGVETRNGGWLSTETIKNGSGPSVTIDKAHRFATKEEAEAVALEFRAAGGQAKRTDSKAWGRGKVQP